MKRIASAVLLASASVLGLTACSNEAPAAKLVGNTVDNYMLADGSGMGHILRYDTHTPAVVLASYVNGDEASRATAKALMALKEKNPDLVIQLINSNPDLGRVPGRTPEMARIRRAFVAGPGKLLMSVDFSQLGLFVLAHLTKDPALCEPLRERTDLHRLTASAVLELPAESLSYEQRQTGKVVNFATFAGQGASALSLQLGLTPEQAREYIARFYRRYAKVREFQEEQLRLVRERGYVITLAGRRWPIGGLESQDPMLRSYAERLAKRATHEGSVNDVSRRALLEVDRALRRAGLETKPLLLILDEVLFEVPEQELEQAARLCATTMRDAFALEVPLRVGVEVGPNWADISPFPLN